MDKDKLFGYATCPLCETEKFKAIDEVIDGCAIFDELDDKEMFRKAVHDREKVETTGVGHGVAIAHGKLDTIHKIRIGLGISQEGVEFESKDGKPVHILFVISSSANLQIQYIKALASILRNVRNAEIREEVTRIFEPGFVPNRCNLLLKELELQSY